MNKIPLGGELYESIILFKVPKFLYWIVWLKEVHVLEIVTKYWDIDGYYFNRIGYIRRPEYYIPSS